METKYGKHRRLNSMFQDHRFLPEDILIDILLRVEARHLARLRFVCKSWCSVIDDIDFIERHYRLHYSICKADGDIPFLCMELTTNNDNSYYLKVSLLSKHTGDVPLDLNPNLLVDSAPCFTNTPNIFKSATVACIVKGVVCILWWKYQDLGLWNPATREFKALTPWSSCRIQNYYPEVIGFGFDCISNDIKTLRGNRYQDGTKYYELHSLKTNSWKRLTEPAPVFWTYSYLMGAYLNGVGYWIAYTSDTPDIPIPKYYNRVPLILSFNFHTEVFEVCNLPDDKAIVREPFPYFYEEALTVYKEERLAFVLKRTDTDIGESHFDAWTVTEVDGNSGTPVSWQHLFTSRSFHEFESIHFKAFRMDGNMVVSLYDRSSQPRKYVHRVYNPTTDTFQKCVYNPTTDTFEDVRFNYFEYVESLSPLSERRVRTQEVLEN